MPCAGQPGSTSRRSAFPPQRLGIPDGDRICFPGVGWRRPAGARPSRPSHGTLGQVLVAVEVVTEDETVSCDLVLARERVMGAPRDLRMVSARLSRESPRRNWSRITLSDRCVMPYSDRRETQRARGPLGS